MLRAGFPVNSMATSMPSGPQPSLVTTASFAVAVVFPILGSIAVALRFYAHARIKKQRPSSDDWVCALAQLAAWGISIDTFVAAGMAGIDHTYPSLNPLAAAVIFLRVSRSLYRSSELQLTSYRSRRCGLRDSLL